MMRARVTLTVFLIPVVIVATPASASFTVDDWFLGCRVDPPGDPLETVFFSTVTNPFRDSHSVTIGPSAAEAAYDFVWTELMDSFRIDASHSAFDVNSSTLCSFSSGVMHISPTADLELHVTGSYDYDLPADNTVATMEFRVAGHLLEFERADSFDGHVVGTLEFENSIVLPADATYQIQYLFRIQSFAGGSGQIGTGDGFIEFTLNTVREPATPSLLA